MGISISVVAGEVVAGEDDNSSRVNALGSDQHIVTNDECNTFGVTDSGLKKAVGDYVGKKQNDAFSRFLENGGSCTVAYGP